MGRTTAAEDEIETPPPIIGYKSAKYQRDEKLITEFMIRYASYKHTVHYKFLIHARNLFFSDTFNGGTKLLAESASEIAE